jgi:addiction module RelE/StbE family toxin
MYQIIKNKTFSKSYKKINPKYIKFIDWILKRLFIGPPFEKEHNVHPLSGKFNKYLSINITGDYRIIFTIDNKDKIIYLYDIWTHAQLYK